MALAKNEPCPVCGRYEDRTSVVDMIIMKDDKILLGKRKNDPFKGQWALFGGYLDWDETVEDAVRRETKEESHLDVTDMKLFGVYSNPTRHPHQVISLVHIIQVSGIPEAGDDIMQVQWFAIHDLPHPLASDHQEIIEDYAKSMDSK